MTNLVQQLTQELQAQTQYNLQLKKLIRKQQAALEAFMQFYDSREALGNWEKKTVGNAPGYETSKSIGDAYEAIRTILVFRGEDELVAWLDEMNSTIVQYAVQASILYKAGSLVDGL